MTKSWLWHHRLSHLNFRTINHLAKQGLVKGLPILMYAKDHLCLVCQMGKSKKESHKAKPKPSINHKLQMLRMDLCGPIQVESISGKKYVLVIVHDYSRFTWVQFMRTKDKTPEVIIKILKQAQVSLQATVRYLRTDNGTKFVNHTLRLYTEYVGITHQALVVGTLQQNGVVERRNPMLVEVALTSAKPPTKNDLDLLFQPTFNEYFKLLSVVPTTISVATLPPLDTARASSPSSIDQDAPSLSTSRINETTTTPIQFTNVEEPNNEDEDTEFDSDTFTNPFAPLVTSSVESTSRIKALYGLKQAPRAWYDLLSKFLLSQKFVKGVVDPTLFTWKKGEDILLLQIYVDDIVFSSTNPSFCDDFANKMSKRFKMSMMRKMSFFLGLQISQNPRGIFINQSKYALEMLKKYGLEQSDAVDTPMVERSKLDEDLKGIQVDPTCYRSKAYRKALTAVKRIMQGAKIKGRVHREVHSFWVKSYDSKSAIALSCNTIQHSRKKHIAVRYHFIKEQVDNEIVELYFVKIDYQLENIFTKLLARERFEFLINRQCMQSITPEEPKHLAELDEE
ncbi:retrovirus-related pol polyprotein from transposon TNT 1-94 [Tanacetum coccineum]